MGRQLYLKTKEEKAASPGFSSISNHTFVDGNKRIRVYVILTFLEAESIKIDCSNKDVVNLGLSVAVVTLLTLCRIKNQIEELLKIPVDVITLPIPDDSMIEINKVVSLYAA